MKPVKFPMPGKPVGRPPKVTLSRAQAHDLKIIFVHESARNPRGAALRAWRKLCVVAWDYPHRKPYLPAAAREVIRDVKATFSTHHS